LPDASRNATVQGLTATVSALDIARSFSRLAGNHASNSTKSLTALQEEIQRQAGIWTHS
jgi:hypothetical protein